MSWHHGYLAVIFAGLLFMAETHSAYATGPGDEVTDKVHRIEIKILNRKVVRDSSIRVVQDDAVELVWTTDEVASLHLHGYDIELEITPSAPVVMAFTAYATGRFPITSHRFKERQHNSDRKTLIYLEVYPR